MSYSLPQRNHSQPHVTPPEGVSAMVDRFPRHGAADTLRAASRGLATSYADIAQTKGRIERDRTMTEGGKLVRLASYAKTKLDGAFAEYRVAEIQTLEARAHLYGRMTAPFDMSKAPDGSPRPLAQVLLAQEIRQRFASIPRPDRLSTLQSAIDAYDERVLIAVTAAPPFVSGLNEALWHVARELVITRNAAGEAEAYKAVSEAHEIAVNIERTLLHSVANLIDFATAADYQRSAVS